jgi:hypothetical protein
MTCIHTSPSLSLKKILAYVQNTIKSERRQPKKQVKAQEKSNPLAALPLSQATQGKHDFAASILNHKMVDTPLTSSAVSSLSNAVHNIQAPVKDSLYTDHVKAEELKVAKEEAKQAEAKRTIASPDMDKYIKLVSLVLARNLGTDKSENPWATNPLAQANAEDASMMDGQLNKAMSQKPTGAPQDPELGQDAHALKQLTEEQQQENMANDAMYEEDARKRGRPAGQKA